MKPRFLFSFAAFFFFSFTLFSQNSSPSIYLKTGVITPTPNISLAYIDSFNKKLNNTEGKAFALLQFEKIPNEHDKKTLFSSGIVLLDYIPHNAYTVSINGPISLGALQQTKAIALLEFLPRQKMDENLAKANYPEWSVKVAGTVDVWISFPKTYDAPEILQLLKENYFDITNTDLQAYRIIGVRVAKNRIETLASFPFVEYVQPIPRPDHTLNQSNRNASRATVLNASVANGGKNLNGEGVVIGIGDNTTAQPHIDFYGRLINRNTTTGGAHGIHVAGIAAGGGIVNERYRGYAPKSTIIDASFSRILQNASVYVKDHGMVLTNNSYGGGGTYGQYEMTSQFLDQQALDLPELLNVFAAGNSGSDSYLSYPSGFHTVLGAYQSAKNVLSVGNTTDSGLIITASSKGPVLDGRLKPEISAMGTGVISTWPTNGYVSNTGTSMSTPAVTGGLSLLYQRYRQLNGNANPKSGLMKAIICNGAADKGNAGPDFSYGFGWMNLLRSVDMLENNRYFITSITSGSSNNHSISIPANTAQLKVMLYWHDPVGSLLSSKALVNDLDLEVTNPSLQITLPKILNATPARVNDPATLGADHLNNMEQVVVDVPAAGNYVIKVKGTTIAQNPSQEYFVVYDVIPVSLKLTYPVGGEGLVPGENVKITWDAYGDANSFSLQYSIDNGLNWIDIATNIEAGRRLFTWTVPSSFTSTGLIRITKNSSTLVSSSNPFTIVGLPGLSLSSTQCEGYVALNWTVVTGATDYEIMKLESGEMKPVATTASSSYNIGSLSVDSTYWLSVRARVDGKPGRRALAIERQPSDGNCSGTISDNDLKIQAILSPRSGRKFTSSQLSVTTPVTVEIKNIDDSPSSDFKVQYSVNGGSFVTEDVAVAIPAGGTYVHTFSNSIDMSALGNYNVLAIVKNNLTDNEPKNDTAFSVIRHIDNQPVLLTNAFIDNLETAVAKTYNYDTIGLQGIERYDFENSLPFGQLTTFLNSGLAYSGNKAFFIGEDRQHNPPGSNNFITGTFNLANYSVITDDVRLDFRYLFTQFNYPLNKVSVRGSDIEPWIEVFDFNANRGLIPGGSYKKSASIEIADSLAKYGQSFTSSSQIRWGASTNVPSLERNRIWAVDDISLYKVFNDLQMIRVDTPVNLSCGLNNNVPVKVTVHNSNNTALNNIPVQYIINGLPAVTEIISSIAANTTIQYTFNQKANLSVTGVYTLKAILNFPSDSYRLNDTITATIHNAPLVSTFPHLQNFESGNGGFYADGTNSSWEYGTPASLKINKAASGTKAWKTRLAGNHNDEELSNLYSPCYDIGNLSVPTLSFSIALDLEDCGAVLCDYAFVQYSADGKIWRELGKKGQGTNWYNQVANKWSIQDYTRWHVVTIPLPDSVDRIRFRFIFGSDEAVNNEGIAIDDVHVYDNDKGIYDSVTLSSPVTKTVSGNSWIDFTSDGKLVASISPNNQNLGSTSVQVFIDTTGVRNTNAQYYHPRNLTIKPLNTSLTDSTVVRFYFTDVEMEKLLAATGCADCSKPASAYELGVSKYSDPDDNFENGTINDDQQGVWNFIASDQVIKVPFDKGYYAEFKVKDFSEFWLNNGGLDKSTPLPVKLMDFTAAKLPNNDVLLKWEVGSETNVLRYEIELARSEEDLSANRFTKIGEVKSHGNNTSLQSYTFTDTEPGKSGARYYRLKIVNADGSIHYSVVRSVVFADPVTWQVYPNPSSGRFSLVYQLNTSEKLQARVFDGNGRLLQQHAETGSGFLQKITIDLRNATYANGIYLLHVEAAGKHQSFKLYKQ